MTTKFKRFLLFFMVLLLSAGQVMAQDNRAVISGIVTDETGMGVIGAAIQVKNESTGFNTGSITNENGEYTIKQLPLGGPYSITVTYVGYGDQKKTGYTLNQGDLLRLDFQLKEESVVSGGGRSSCKFIEEILLPLRSCYFRYGTRPGKASCKRTITFTSLD